MKLFTGSMMAQALSLVLAPILARLYSPEDFGLVALYLGILNILSVLSTAKYEQAIMLPMKQKDALYLVYLVWGISAIVALMVLMAAILCNTSLSQLTGNPNIGPWLYFLPLSILFHGAFQSATYFANRNKRFGLMAKATIAHYTILNATRVIAGWARSGFNGLIGGQIVAQATSAIYTFAGVWPLMQAAHKATPAGEEQVNLTKVSLCQWIHNILKQARIYIGYPKYNMPLNLTNTISGSLPVFLFTWGFSPAIAGLYIFAFSFVFRPIGLFSQSTTQVLSQKIIEKHHQHQPIYPAIRNMAVRLFVLFILPAIMMAVWAPKLFGILFTEEYVMAGTMLQYMSPYLLMVFITSPLSFIPELLFKQKRAMVLEILHLFLRILALGTGIIYKDYLLALGLYSLVGFLLVGYCLYWYLQIAKLNDNNPGTTISNAYEK